MNYTRTFETLRAGIEEKVFPGAVAGIWQGQDPTTFSYCALGSRRLVPPPEQKVHIDTVFDIASVSKVMATATLTALLVERGWLRWETPIQQFLPSFPNPDVRIKHLLSHTAGLPAWAPLWESLRTRMQERYPHLALHQISVEERQKEMRNLVLAIGPDAPIESRTVYFDISFLLLGFVLEEATQMPLDRAVRELLWNPMKLSFPYYQRITKSVQDSVHEEVAATEDCPWRGGVLQGQVHDDNCWAMGGYGGHAGVFARARDVLEFAAKLLNGFLSHEILQEMWTRVERPVGCERTLGWDTPSGEHPSFTHHFSPRSVGHLGFTGTSLWIDPDRELAVVLLTNRVHPSRENPLMKPYRHRFHEALWLDLSQNSGD